jgi:dihydrofolate reductase
MTIVSIIAGIGKNRELGAENKLLWNIPEDLKYFREKTSGHPVIVGRKTFESIGRLLPNRPNIIVTRDENYSVPGAIICHSLPEAITEAKKLDLNEIFIIGGANIYAQAINLADKLYLTVVNAEFPADTFFPEYKSRFKTVVSQRVSHDKNFNYTFWELTP